MRIIQITKVLMISTIFSLSSAVAISFDNAAVALNTTYQTALQSIDPTYHEKLQKLQRQWIQYRDQSCELRVKHLKENNERCKAALTVEQTYFLTLLSAQRSEDKEFYALLFSDQFAAQVEQYRHYLSNKDRTFIQIIDQIVDDRYLSAYVSLPKSSQKTLASSFGLWRDLTLDLCNLIDIHSEIGVQFCIGSRSLGQINGLALLAKLKGKS